MSFGFSVGDIIACSQLALKAYTSLKSAPKEFEGLRLEVLSLNTTLNALADEASSGTSIVRSSSPQRRESLRLLLENCSKGLSQLNEFLLRNPDVRKGKFGRDRVGFAWKEVAQAIQTIRDKLGIHTASINIFLTSLTHASLGRLELSLQKTLRFGIPGAVQAHVGGGFGQGGGGGFGISAVRDPNQSFQPQPAVDDGFEGVWTSIGQDLALQDITKENVEQFQEEVKSYLRHLVSGGTPFWKDGSVLQESRHEYDRSKQQTVFPTGSLAMDEKEAVTYTEQVPVMSVEDKTSSKADNFEAKIASHVEDEISSGEGETFVYEDMQVKRRPIPEKELKTKKLGSIEEKRLKLSELRKKREREAMKKPSEDIENLVKDSGKTNADVPEVWCGSLEELVKLRKEENSRRPAVSKESPRIVDAKTGLERELQTLQNSRHREENKLATLWDVPISDDEDLQGRRAEQEVRRHNLELLQQEEIEVAEKIAEFENLGTDDEQDIDIGQQLVQLAEDAFEIDDRLFAPQGLHPHYQGQENEGESPDSHSSTTSSSPAPSEGVSLSSQPPVLRPSLAPSHSDTKAAGKSAMEGKKAKERLATVAQRYPPAQRKGDKSR